MTLHGETIKAAALIVAGGSGTRMGGPTRKQYLELGGQPILVHTLKLFLSAPFIIRVVLVAPAADHNWIRGTLLAGVPGGDRVIFADAGAERQASVMSGLKELGDDFHGVVAVHDAVRPFVTHHEIARCVEEAHLKGGAILATPAHETVKRVGGGAVLETLPREGIWMAQTPQAFDAELLRRAHAHALDMRFQGTDDASLVEYLGKPVSVLPGSRINVKITTPEDLVLAELFLKIRSA